MNSFARLTRGIPVIALTSLIVAADLSFAQSTSTGSGQAYPVKTVRIVIAYPNGGGADFTARPIAQKLTERWGQSVIVESRPGGSAMIGTDFVAKSPPEEKHGDQACIVAY